MNLVRVHVRWWLSLLGPAHFECALSRGSVERIFGSGMIRDTKRRVRSLPSIRLVYLRTRFFGCSGFLFTSCRFVPLFGFTDSSSSSFSSSSPLSSSSSLSFTSSLASATNPSHRPPSSLPSSHVHIGRLMLVLVLMCRLWMLSQPPLI